ncbi:cAMP-dependent protein kinase catalytic subunit gamma-like [Galendromus occidentalis]|uniref:cAMP-dependent protein kinase catalytic subunit gamma-like n=1 Tax=Galendromus occidentalis TaxID=34638 RepID=A0AAJ6QR49_9ACAR|nr:cAMP-dependent protein kinase catalytic subunit gamma-like [Galendromus occidentalis]
MGIRYSLISSEERAQAQSEELIREARLRPFKLGDLFRNKQKKYKKELLTARSRFQSRFEANACPKEQLENFRNLGYVSRGAFGIVFKVKYLRDGRVFALKQQPKQSFNEANRPRALKEKKVQYALQNHFVLELVFAFQDAENLYLISPYAEHGDLERFMGAGRLSERVVKLLGAQMILGLEYLHSCDVCYRDLKPNNVFIFEDGYLKLGDFGLAKMMRQEDTTYTFTGSPRYMAPEMFLEDGYQRIVDFYALGVTLFECLYDQLPFAGRNWSDPPAEGRKVIPKFPEHVDEESSAFDFFCWLLADNPNFRLGVRHGVNGIKEHPFFDGVEFKYFISKRARLRVLLPPINPAFVEREQSWPRPSGLEDIDPFIHF